PCPDPSDGVPALETGLRDPSDRRVLGPAGLHRSPSSPKVSAPRSRRHLARLPLPLGHLHGANRDGAGRRTAAPRAPHLGSWLDPCAVAPDGPGTAGSLRTNPPTLVRASRSVPSAGGATGASRPGSGNRTP